MIFETALWQNDHVYTTTRNGSLNNKRRGNLIHNIIIIQSIEKSARQHAIVDRCSEV